MHFLIFVVALSVAWRFRRYRLDRWRYRFAYMLLLFQCIFFFFALSATSRFYRDRLDRWRYGFAHILLLFQRIFLFFDTFSWFLFHF